MFAEYNPREQAVTATNSIHPNSTSREVKHDTQILTQKFNFMTQKFNCNG